MRDDGALRDLLVHHNHLEEVEAQARNDRLPWVISIDFAVDAVGDPSLWASYESPLFIGKILRFAMTLKEALSLSFPNKRF